ncbi:MAG: hypothetical protein M4579_002971 [Chaenotheca gracillima]|nr:MAG: hypothetical protein M4579_002971 [Chaenotheca gracillima]
MAQGIVKKSNASKATGRKSTSLGPKKGARTIAPKKSSLKHTSGLTAKTERNLAEKAGHLEMLGKGQTKKGSGNKGQKDSHSTK